jgi:hypothetical protein
LIFEVRKTRVVGLDLANLIIHWSLIEECHPTQLVLVAAGVVSQAARAALTNRGIEIWDAPKLAELTPPDLLQDYFGTDVSTPASALFPS